MSLDQTGDVSQDGANTAMSELGWKVSHKSYRRKYRKIMVRFEETMKESNSLFKDEQRILDISRRLAEQNDQIIQLLADLNSCPQIPPSMRYDLVPPGAPENSASSQTGTYDTTSAQAALRTGRLQLRNGESSLKEYHDLEDSILRSQAFAPTVSYKSLLKTRHTHANVVLDTKLETGNPISNGYLTAQQEDQYLQGLDAYLGGQSTSTRPHAASIQPGGSADKSIEREREMQLRNPVSVYNWLRDNQPQVFLQDNEVSTEKPSRPAGSRVSKRTLANTKTSSKQDPDLYDDDGIAREVGPTARVSKRKRTDDPPFRNKGGTGRGQKRKKDDAPPSAKRSKKLSMSDT